MSNTDEAGWHPSRVRMFSRAVASVGLVWDGAP